MLLIYHGKAFGRVLNLQSLGSARASSLVLATFVNAAKVRDFEIVLLLLLSLYVLLIHYYWLVYPFLLCSSNLLLIQVDLIV